MDCGDQRTRLDGKTVNCQKKTTTSWRGSNWKARLSRLALDSHCESPGFFEKL
jgi:hypothetical protein